MALHPKEVDPSTQVITFPIVQCGCGCGPINLNEHAYIYSKATGQYYADMVCMSKALDEDIDMMDRRAKKRFLEDWEAVEVG